MGAVASKVLPTGVLGGGKKRGKKRVGVHRDSDSDSDSDSEAAPAPQ